VRIDQNDVAVAVRDPDKRKELPEVGAPGVGVALAEIEPAGEVTGEQMRNGAKKNEKNGRGADRSGQWHIRRDARMYPRGRRDDPAERRGRGRAAERHRRGDPHDYLSNNLFKCRCKATNKRDIAVRGEVGHDLALQVGVALRGGLAADRGLADREEHFPGIAEARARAAKPGLLGVGTPTDNLGNVKNV